MKRISNQIMLITYADSMGGNLKRLRGILHKYFEGVIGGIHILPFYPSSGDRGFAVVNYDGVDPAFGDWSDIRRFSEEYYMMADFMVNHVSVRSAEFRDYMENGDASGYRDMFIRWDEFWPGGEPAEADMEALYRRKLNGPYKEFTRRDGKKVKLWNTFFDEQVDINPDSTATKAYYERNLRRLAEYFPLIRLDAFAYASKRPGTSCFFVEPDIWRILGIITHAFSDRGTQVLPEIHENYKIQMKMSEKGYWVYDFALPMLLLHGLMTGRTDRLTHWLKICPRKQFTTLDTHDGIGVADVAGLLTDDEIDFVRERVNRKTSANMKYVKFPAGIVKTSGKKARQYQLMCSFYSALDENDAAYLLARIVQLYAPGIPQVYYVGMLAGENDVESLKRTGEIRSVNRHNYTEAEIAGRVECAMLQRMYEIMRFRNSFPAFSGNIEIGDAGKNGLLSITWENGKFKTALNADFRTLGYRITFDDGTGPEKVLFQS